LIKISSLKFQNYNNIGIVFLHIQVFIHKKYGVGITFGKFCSAEHADVVPGATEGWQKLRENEAYGDRKSN
jgi:hypothetical protein